MTQEEPFLQTDSSGAYSVFVPALAHNSSGPSWASGTAAGTSIPISKFFIATPGTPMLAIDAALALGKNLILTPGVYNLKAPILVSRPNTVVLGLGFPTLVPQNGTAAMQVLAGQGVKLSGMIFDAGPKNSPVLLQVGNPLTAGIGSRPIPRWCRTCSSASAGRPPARPPTAWWSTARTSSWTTSGPGGRTTAPGPAGPTNPADTGLVVNGNNVTAYGLAVEHYQKNEVIWNGQGGEVIFFQNEMPYDPPSQAAWMSSPTTDGYPAFLIPARGHELLRLRHGQLLLLQPGRRRSSRRPRSRCRTPRASSCTTCSPGSSTARAASITSSTTPARR